MTGLPRSEGSRLRPTETKNGPRSTSRLRSTETKNGSRSTCSICRRRSFTGSGYRDERRGEVLSRDLLRDERRQEGAKPYGGNADGRLSSGNRSERFCSDLPPRNGRQHPSLANHRP